MACHILLESFKRGLQLCFRPHLNQRFAHKFMDPKVVEVLILGISGLPFGVLRQNDIWVLISWPEIKYTIWGKVVASQKSRSWWVLWVHVYLWLVRAPKCSNYALTNLLFSLCRSVWVIESLVNLTSPHPKVPACPSTLEVLQARECALILSPSIVFA